MSIDHSEVGGGTSNCHEPKGVVSASDGAIMTANSSVSGWVLPCYGELSITGNSTAFTPVAADIAQYKHLTNSGWAVGTSSSSVTPVATVGSESIIVSVAGDYLITFWCSFETSAATGTTFGLKYAVDGTTATRKIIVQKNSSGADIKTIAAQGILALTASQDLEIHLSSSAATDLVITDAGLTLQRLK